MRLPCTLYPLHWFHAIVRRTIHKTCTTNIQFNPIHRDFRPKLKKPQRKYIFLLNICPIFKEKYYLCSCLKISKYEYN